MFRVKLSWKYKNNLWDIDIFVVVGVFIKNK